MAFSSGEAAISWVTSYFYQTDMTYSKSIMQKLAATLLLIVGVAAMVSAWFILLTTATHSYNVVALEVGGVVVTLSGYFLWQYSNRSRKEQALSEQTGLEKN
ncbi:MAG: hypothetical protein LUQ44_07220 [Methanothrix sp.]|jgi:membrane protein YdbS with pleckstrin-like domain|nr:hypothetical protein [Methanothrix sp.]